MASAPVTERRLANGADLDLRPTLELVELVNDQDATVARAVRGAAPALATAIDAIVERLATGGRLVYVGAGTSGRLALVDATEVGPTFGIAEGTVTAILAGGEAKGTAQEAAEDDEEQARADVAEAGVGPQDAVVLLSASGRTPYVIAAAGAARASGALTVGVACAEGSPLESAVDLPVTAVTGPEVVAGSTRMKAGTAQKLILNTISTVAMIRLGRTFGDLMVDVVAANAKLRARARRTVLMATGASPQEVDAVLERAGGEAKVAIVALLAGVDVPTARARLVRADGAVRRALETA